MGPLLDETARSRVFSFGTFAIRVISTAILTKNKSFQTVQNIPRKTTLDIPATRVAEVAGLDVLVDEQFYALQKFELVEVRSPVLIEFLEEEVSQSPGKQVKRVFHFVWVVLEERRADGLEASEQSGLKQRRVGGKLEESLEKCLGAQLFQRRQFSVGETPLDGHGKEGVNRRSRRGPVSDTKIKIKYKD